MKRIAMTLMVAALAGLQMVTTLADDKAPGKKRARPRAAKTADTQEESSLVEEAITDESLAADPAFDRYVDLNVLGLALNTADSGLLTDVTLQLAEGERILLRERKSMSAKTMAQLATKLAIAKNDKEALQRLAKFATACGDEKLARQVSAAEKLAGPSRSAAVDLSAEDPADAAAYQMIHDQITAGRLLQDWRTLDEIEQELKQLEELPKRLNDELIAYASKDKKLRGPSRVVSESELLRLAATLKQAQFVQNQRAQVNRQQQYGQQQYGQQQYGQPQNVKPPRVAVTIGFGSPVVAVQSQRQFSGTWYSNESGFTVRATIGPGGSPNEGAFTWVEKDHGVLDFSGKGTVKCYNNRSVLVFYDRDGDIDKYDVKWGVSHTSGRTYIELWDRNSSYNHWDYKLWKQ